MKNNFVLSPSDLSAVQKAVSAMPFYDLDSDLVDYVNMMSLAINEKIATASLFSFQELLFVQEAIGYAMDALQGLEPLDQEHLLELRPYVFTFNSLNDRLSSSLEQ